MIFLRFLVLLLPYFPDEVTALQGIEEAEEAELEDFV